MQWAFSLHFPTLEPFLEPQAYPFTLSLSRSPSQIIHFFLQLPPLSSAWPGGAVSITCFSRFSRSAASASGGRCCPTFFPRGRETNRQVQLHKKFVQFFFFSRISYFLDSLGYEKLQKFFFTKFAKFHLSTHSRIKKH